MPEWEEGEERVFVNREGYTQHYNVRGNPENRQSRSLARHLRRAQNDVLATVGVCAPIDMNGRFIPQSTTNTAREQLDKQQVLSVTSENELGFWLGAADISVSALSRSCFVGLRQRLEVCICKYEVSSLTCAVDLFLLLGHPASEYNAS